MNRLQKKFGKMIQRVIDSAMGNGLMQEEMSASGEHYVTPGMPELIRRAGAESCVLLKNNGCLPLAKDKEVAVFGRCQLDWFYVGYGSGGDVNAPYKVSLIEGLENAGVKLNQAVIETYKAWTAKPDNEADHGWWGHWPMNYPEMPITPELAKEAAKTADAAVVVIGRAAGEDRENTLTKGSYYLTDEERTMLDTVCAAFGKVAVLMNIGNIIDFSWTEEYADRISALMIVWQGGMESGNAVADVLLGKTSPCGLLPDTIARRYEDYPSSANFGGKEYNEYKEGIYVGYRWSDMHPETVLYPFGFGLSYTSFEIKPLSLTREAGSVKAKVCVTNTGSAAGKTAILLWCSAPKGRIDKPVKVLAAFAKTSELTPGGSEELELAADDKCLASFDEASSAFVLETGDYSFTAAGSADSKAALGSILIGSETIVEKCTPLCKDSAALKERILAELPAELKAAGTTADFADVLTGKISPQDFAAALNSDDLEALSRGHGMMGSPLGTAGNAGVFGGVTDSLQKKHVPPIVCCDGPAGLRLKSTARFSPAERRWQQASTQSLPRPSTPRSEKK